MSREEAPGRPAEHEPITVTDKRRVDPVTGQVRDADSGPAPSGSASEPASVSAETQSEAAELIADLQRVQADFTNYRKRALRDQQLATERAKAHVVTQLLPVLDDLDRARAHGDLDSAPPLKAVADKLVGVLQGLGLAAFGSEGEEFDPALHEAVQHEGDGSHSVIGTVMRRGYKVGEHVVRHAMVGVVDTVPDVPGADNGESAAQEPAES